ncbi:MAG: glycosyltransferase family 2 protein, partial [Candidatus Rokuibacteriota bacterium]
GLRYGRRLGCDTVVRIDGDGQHPVHEIARLLAPIRAGQADAVQGSRYVGTRDRAASTVHDAGRRALGTLLSLVTREGVTDPTSGFWAFGPRAVRLLAEHHPTGYPEPELRLLLWRNGLRVVEVPVRMRPRLAGRTSLTWSRASLALARAALATVVVPLRPGVVERDPAVRTACSAP